MKEVTFYPRKDNEWEVIATYEVAEPELLPDNGRYLAIDLGVRNFVTTYTSDGDTFIVGKQFLELNHYYNKRIAHFQSISAAQQSAAGVKYPKSSKYVLSLYRKYNNCIEDLLHKTSAYIRDYCLLSRINTVIVGDITGIRNGKNLNRSNQPFHALPYRKLIFKLQYKLRLAGIRVVMHHEAYSSQCSPHTPEVSAKYAVGENRIYRGLYKDGNEIFHADTLGAFNILRMTFPNAIVPLPYRVPIKVSV